MTVLLLTTGSAVPASARPAADPGDPWVVRSTTVELRREHFSYLCDRPDAGPPAATTLSVFPYEVQARVVEDQSDDDQQGTIVWDGHEADAPEHSVHVQVTHACDGKGPIYLEGYADLGPRGYFHVEPDPGHPGTARFEQWDLAKLPRRTSDDTDPGRPAEDGTDPGRPSDVDGATPGPRGRTKPDRSKPAVVDVLLVYTPKAAAMARGDKQFRSVAASARTAETRMNRALSDSEVKARVDVVDTLEVKSFKGWKVPVDAKKPKGAQQDVELDDGAMLNLLENPKDKHLGAQVAEERDRQAADLAVLVTGHTGNSGISNGSDAPGQATADDSANAVISYDSIFLQTFSHEVGHNLALAHDRWTLKHDQAGSGSPSTKYPYNPGWITPDQKWATIMAYEWNCEQGNKTCPIAYYYANRIHRWHGQPLGDRNNDQTRVLRQTAYLVQDYRTPKKPRPRQELTLDTSPKAGGTVRPLVWGPYRTGTRVVVKAAARPGYAFSGWDLDGQPHANTTPDMSLLMNSAHSLTARFEMSCAHPVTSAFAKKWRDLRGAKGRLKCPEAAERRLKGGTLQYFQGGSLYWSRTTGAHPVWGAFRSEYGKLGWERGRLGYPTTDEQRIWGGKAVRQRFEGGALTYDVRTKQVSVWLRK
ncbi:M12 family metallo-peptidase [Streptomyces sp. NPDC059009]|uniref:InlB B-repeat-containing protein n=1 Tax=Streptomyces sp. NPDC059009 TaxID=3346694 RepID=UPI0036CF4855